MRDQGGKTLVYLIVVLAIAALVSMYWFLYMSHAAVDILHDDTTSIVESKLPEKGDALGIRPETAGKFYEKTIAGSPFREGKLNWTKLMELIKSNPSVPITLKLLRDVEIEFLPTEYTVIKRKNGADAHRFRWTGRVTDKEKVVGQAFFIVNEEQRTISGTINYNDEVYEIVPLKNGNIRIYKFDPKRFPEDKPKPQKYPAPVAPAGGGTFDGPIVSPTTPPKEPSGNQPHGASHDPQDSAGTGGGPEVHSIQPEPSDISCVINVLVLYTQEAEETFHKLGHADIKEAIRNIVDLTHWAFSNSKVSAELQASEPRLIPSDLFQESPNLDVSLGQIQDNTNYPRLASTVSRWRDEAEADLVSLWVSGGDDCGAANLFMNRAPREGDGFTVVVVGCAVTNLSFAHEIGHNLGARHTHWDEEQAGYDHKGSNFGHASLPEKVRTIMAYPFECREKGFECRREAYYSNPNIPYPGTDTKTGIAQPSDNAADNHATLNNNCKIVEQFRPRTSPG